jgi:hypothetical protein
MPPNINLKNSEISLFLKLLSLVWSKDAVFRENTIKWTYTKEDVTEMRS